MTVTTQRRLTLAEYLTHDDGSDTRYELVDGVLVDMGAESRVNIQIAIFLIFTMKELGLMPDRLGIKEKIQITSPNASARDPDLIIHSEASALAIAGRKESCLFLGEPNPLLVVEVASPGNEASDNYQRDYVQKSMEYADRGIPEYWIVDADRAWVKVGTLDDRTYQFQTFQGDSLILSPTFPRLSLTAAQVLKAGR
ncbi:MAG: Uma2 family endonuclease [Synechococcales bacterium]|nr:Uma2 family endonuclease [Synechococcales bacterium]